MCPLIGNLFLSFFLLRLFFVCFSVSFRYRYIYIYTENINEISLILQVIEENGIYGEKTKKI